MRQQEDMVKEEDGERVGEGGLLERREETGVESEGASEQFSSFMRSSLTSPVSVLRGD